MHNIGDIIQGTVYDVKPYALFLKFEDNSIGLLHISEISNHFIKDIENFATFNDQIKVKIISIDSKNGFLRLSFKQLDEKDQFNSHDINQKKININDNGEFKFIEEKMPDWINQAIENINGDKK